MTINIHSSWKDAIIDAFCFCWWAFICRACTHFWWHTSSCCKIDSENLFSTWQSAFTSICCWRGDNLLCVCVCVLLSLAFQMANCSFYKHFTGLQRFQTAQVCWFHSESLHSLSTFLSYSFSHVEAKQPHFKVLTTWKLTVFYDKKLVTFITTWVLFS